MRLRHDLLPMRAYQKALAWDPRAIALDRDGGDLAALGARERDATLRLLALFRAGEEAVAGDLAPLLVVLSAEGRAEDAIFLTSQLFEEARHVEFFHRWCDEVPGPFDAAGYHTPAYRTLFYEALPASLTRLLRDPSPEAQAEAVATYHMIVEGVLAETGYRATAAAFEAGGVLPGLVQGMRLVQRDEARHVAFGVYLLRRLLAAHPGVWGVIEARMNTLLGVALALIGESYAPYGDRIPFGLDPAQFVGFAADQFARRMGAVERARVMRLEDVLADHGDADPDGPDA